MGVKILVVDDDYLIRDMLFDVLSRYSHEVDVAANVDEAVEMMKSNKYEIILTDKNMPGKENPEEGGLYVLKYTKKLLPAAEVIIMTAFGNLESAVEAMQWGAFDYIKKPFEFDELLEKIDRIIEYKSYASTSNVIPIYKQLFSEILGLAQKQYKPTDQELHKILKSIFNKIDSFFNIQRERDKSFINISRNLKSLKESIDQSDKSYGFITNIDNEVSKQLQQVSQHQSNTKIKSELQFVKKVQPKAKPPIN